MGSRSPVTEPSPLHTLISHLRAEPGRFAMLIGAGVSVSAGIPIGQGIINRLKARYPERLHPDRDYSYTEAFNVALPGPHHRGERRALFERLCAGRAPTAEHQMVAHLVDRGIAPIILTTNFDHLIEAALLARSRGPRVYLHDKDIDPAESAVGRPLLLKLHGDFLFEDLANLEDELRAKMTQNMRRKLLRFLRGRGLIVLGYGGNDASVMTLLGEAMVSKECLTHGLWWVFFSPEDIARAPVQRLARKAARHGRSLQFIGPLSAAEFLDSACRGTGVGLPSPVPFGVNPERDDFLSGYVGRFARERQLPPSGARLNKFARSATHVLGRLLRDPGVVLLVGPPRSGKSGVTASVPASIGNRPFFYFSHRFARNPIHVSFDLDLRSLADVVGADVSPSTPGPEVLRRLLQREAVFAFDDLLAFGEIQEAYLDRIMATLRCQAAEGRGCVVLAFSNEPTRGFMRRLEEAVGDGERTRARGKPKRQETHVRVVRLGQEGDDHQSRVRMTKRLRAIRTANPALWRAVATWSTIRLAEPSDFFGEVIAVKGSDTRRVVQELARNGLVDSRDGQYIPREHVQRIMRDLHPPRTRDFLRVAKACERVSADSGYFDKAHYALEAEAHYWAGGDLEAALRQLLPLADSLIAIGSARFLYRTLLDLVRDPSVVKELEPPTRVAVLGSLYRAWRDVVPPDVTFLAVFRAALDEAMTGMDGAWQAVLAAQHAQINGDLRLNGRYLRRAERLLRPSGPSQALAQVQLGISGWAHSVAQADPQMWTTERRVADALRWARRAARTFSAAGDDKGVARACDNATAALLRMGRYEDALSLQEEQIEVHSVEPGFTRDKAVLYGNLFQASLRLERIREAEGYFYQSILNYSNVGDWIGVMRNALFLFEYGLNRDQERGTTLLPSSQLMYRSIRHALASAETPSTRPMIGELTDWLFINWMQYQVRRGRNGAAVGALREFLIAARDREMDEAFPVALGMIAVLVRRFGLAPIERPLRAAIRHGPAWSQEPCSAYLDWLRAPRRGLAALLNSRGVNVGWEEAMRQSWSDSRVLVGRLPREPANGAALTATVSP